MTSVNPDGNSVADSGGNGDAQPPQNVRDMCKNGWLKKMVHVERRRGQFANKGQKPEKYWIVFCIHDNKDAMLEFYSSVHQAFSHQPLESYSLNKCLHVSPCIQAIADDYEFAITLDSQVIRLGASSREEMWEWTDTMKNKLRELKILEPKDNLYSKDPIPPRLPNPNSPSIDSVSTSFTDFQQSPSVSAAVVNQIRASRDRLMVRNPSSPLPPVPPENSPGSIAQENVGSPSRHPLASSSSSATNGSSPTWSEHSTGPSSATHNHYHSSPSVFDFDLSSVSLRDHAIPPPVARRTCMSESGSGLSSPFFPGMTSYHSVDNSIYEPLCATMRPNSFTQGSSSGSQHSLNRNSCTSTNSNDGIPSRVGAASDIDRSGLVMQVSDRLQGASSRQLPVQESFVPPTLPTSTWHDNANFDVLPLEEGPPAYSEVVALSSNMSQQDSGASGQNTEEGASKPLSLKEVQVARLQKEIAHVAGVRLLLRKMDCVQAVAFVECFGAVWIAGWKQKEHPYLYNTLHVGDRVVSIAGRLVRTVQEAMKVIKHHPLNLQVEFVIRRVPHGRVFALKREFEGQDLGLVREGNSAEIKEVVSDGLAARQGVPLKAVTMDGNSLCRWVLTEINNRPLNLFFKDNEVRDRLNAVGKDISILIQPADLVKTLKKQLKALSSYKKYIVQ